MDERRNLNDSMTSSGSARSNKKNYNGTQNGPKETLYIQNVPEDFRHDDIRTICEKYGTVVDVKRFLKNDTSPHTFFVTFDTVIDAKQAIALLRQNDTHGMNYSYAYNSTRNLKGSPSVSSSSDCLEEPSGSSTERCSKCNKNANLSCARCEEPYCSRQCQEVDWIQHKKHCIPMPDLKPLKVTAGDTSKTVNDKSLDRKHQHQLHPQQHYQQTPRQNFNESRSEQSIGLLSSESLTRTCRLNASSGMDGNNTSPQNQRSLRNENLPVRDDHFSFAGKNQQPSANAPEGNAPLTAHIITTPALPNNKVIITHVRNNAFVNVRSVNASDEEDYERIIRDVDNYCRMQRPAYDVELKRGDIVGALNGGRFERGVIIKVIDEPGNQKLFNIGFIDSLTSLSRVSRTNIRIIKGDLQNRKRHSVKCLLRDVKQQSTPDVIDFIENLINSKERVMFRMEYDGEFIAGKTPCELLRLPNNRSLNKKISSLSQEADSLPDILSKDEENPGKKSEILSEKITGKNLKVRIINTECLNIGRLFYTREEDLRTLSDLLQSIQKYCAENTSKPYNPQPDEFILAKYVADNQWYRAKCITENRMEFRLHFIDFGNYQSTTSNNIRPIPKEFMMPCMTCVMDMQGVLSDIKTDTSLYAYLKEKFDNHVIQFDEIVAAEPINQCHSASLLAELREMDLID